MFQTFETSDCFKKYVLSAVLILSFNENHIYMMTERACSYRKLRTTAANWFLLTAMLGYQPRLEYKNLYQGFR